MKILKNSWNGAAIKFAFLSSESSGTHKKTLPFLFIFYQDNIMRIHIGSEEVNMKVNQLSIKSLSYAVGISLICLTFVLSAQVLWGDMVHPRPLMRFPDIQNETIVFVYGEDIWSVPSQGGVARRLTIHDGEERFPKISPDGNTIAFTGEYDGNADVYVMNLHGGDITRVTYHPGNDVVVGWHPVTNKILFQSTRRSFQRFSRLFLISPDGTGLEELILNEAAQGSFSPDGKRIAYNKLQRESRTWKRYQGGMAQDVYVYNFETNEDTRLTEFKGTDRIPMWIGDDIYFSSDRDGVLNIYAVNPNSGEVEQLTHHTEYDVRRPSKGGDKIVYELAGSLWVLDTQAKETKKVPVEIKTDVPEVRPYIKSVDQYIQGYDISPSGQRALIVARGDVFTIPRKNGPTRNLTKNSGARDKDAIWSPDGKRIAYLSDKSGEYEITVVDPLGQTEAVQLTQHKEGYRHTLCWSPDSQKIAFADQTLRCLILDVSTKTITEVDKAHYENVDVSLDLKPISDFNWSPDSRFLAYSKMDSDLVFKIYVYSLETGEINCVSEGLFNDFEPVFSRDGEHLFFVSNRRFNPTFCDFVWEMVYKKAAGIYCLTLKKEGKSLLYYQSDEETSAEDPSKGKNEDKVQVRIDFNGLAERIEALPLPRGNYRQLSVNETHLFFLDADEGDYNRFEFRPKGPRNLSAFSFEERETSEVIGGISGYRLSADGSHLIYQRGEELGIIPASALNSQGAPLALSNLKMRIDPLAEWAQIFNEAWRLERDFYYEPEMHGIDWLAMKEKYSRLLPFASCRQDIRYIVGELIGELNTSHTYVYGGDRKRRADQVKVGLLGADYEIDSANNRYKFKKIYRVPDWSREIAPPLSGPGIDVREGDYLLQVNGVDVTTEANIYSYFLDMAREHVTLLVNSRPTETGAREVIVRTVDSEQVLRYLDWVEHNRRVAEDTSNGQIGYIHLPDTYMGSALEFPKYFYAQMRKKGLIIDGRFNGGGLDPDIFLRRLDKPVHAYWTRRYSHDQTIPDFATRAHMVCLTNRQAGSGGDMLPMEFRIRGMGPIIGTRTWGGLVGVSASIPLVDGGVLTAPDYRIYDKEGQWVIENIGVEPDVTVDLHPAEVARGYDAQLMKAIEILLQKIKEDPRSWPEHRPFLKDKRNRHSQ
jgi:tricorn protease